MNIKKTLGAGLASIGMVVGMTGGLASAFNGGGNHHDYEDANLMHTSSEVELTNDNEVNFENYSRQFAMTGDVEVEENTTASNIGTGGAENANELGAEIEISNADSSVAALAPIEQENNLDDLLDWQLATEGEGQVEVVTTSEVEVVNDNDINVMNIVKQTALSGDVEVTENTTAGSAISGDASNFNSVSMSFKIAN